MVVVKPLTFIYVVVTIHIKTMDSSSSFPHLAYIWSSHHHLQGKKTKHLICCRDFFFLWSFWSQEFWIPSYPVGLPHLDLLENEFFFNSVYSLWIAPLIKLSKTMHLNLLRPSINLISDQLFSPAFRLVFKRWFASQACFLKGWLHFQSVRSSVFLMSVKHAPMFLAGRTLIRSYMRT